jgi:hypothetical protein
MIKISRILKLILLCGFFAAITSCDAIMSLFYCVKNSTKTNIKIKIYDYCRSGYLSGYGWPPCVDTIVELKPGQRIIIGYVDKITGPYWNSKPLFLEKPGIYNFKFVSGDSLVSFEKDDKHWKFRYRTSTFKIYKEYLPW